MKAAEILNMENILSEIKIGKVSDKNVRHSLIVFYRSIAKVANGIREEADLIRKKFMEGNEPLIKKAAEGGLSKAEADEYKALNDAYTAELDSFYGEDIKNITIEGGVKLEDLADALAESGSELRFRELVSAFSILG